MAAAGLRSPSILDILRINNKPGSSGELLAPRLVEGLSHEERARLLPHAVLAVGWERGPRFRDAERERGPRVRDAERRRNDAIDLAPRQEGNAVGVARRRLQDKLPVRVVVVASAYSGDATRTLDTCELDQGCRQEGPKGGQVVGDEAGADGVGVAARGSDTGFLLVEDAFNGRELALLRCAAPAKHPRLRGTMLAAKQFPIDSGPHYRVHALVGVLEVPERAIRAGRNDVVGSAPEAAPCTLLVYARRGTDTDCFFFTYACN